MTKPSGEWMKDLKLGWRLRFGLNFVKGDLMDFVKKLVHGRPALLRSILAAYIFALLLLHVLGLGAYAGTLTSFVTFFGVTPEASGAPFSTEAVVAAALAFAAVLRVVIRWFFERAAVAPEPVK